MGTDFNNLVSPISSKKRREKIDAGIREYYESKKTRVLNEETISSVQKDTEKEKNYELAGSSYRKEKEKKDKLTTLDENFDSNFKESMANLFGVIVYESLPIDEDSKKIDSRGIIEGAKKVFESLYESNTVLITQSPTFKDYAGTVVKHIDNADGRMTEEQIEEVLSVLFTEHHIDLTNTITNIYNKSANTIRTENQIKDFQETEYDQKYISTNSNYVRENFTPTLFRYLNESRIEDITKMEDVDKLKRKDILNLALAESLSHYVILETLNTTKLVKFDTDKLSHAVKY